VTTLSEHVIQLWYSSVFSNQGQAATDAIQLGMVHCICDGFYMSVPFPDFATAAVVFHTKTCATVSPMSLGLQLRSIPIAQNYKASM